MNYLHMAASVYLLLYLERKKPPLSSNYDGTSGLRKKCHKLLPPNGALNITSTALLIKQASYNANYTHIHIYKSTYVNNFFITYIICVN